MGGPVPIAPMGEEADEDDIGEGPAAAAEEEEEEERKRLGSTRRNLVCCGGTPPPTAAADPPLGLKRDPTPTTPPQPKEDDDDFGKNVQCSGRSFALSSSSHSSRLLSASCWVVVRCIAD